MPTTGAARAKEKTLPPTATITVVNKQCDPSGGVDIAANGRVHFDNKDAKEYRLHLSKTKKTSSAGVDILLPANGGVMLVIKKNEVLWYVVDDSGSAASGAGPVRGGPRRDPGWGSSGGGPIRGGPR